MDQQNWRPLVPMKSKMCSECSCVRACIHSFIHRGCVVFAVCVYAFIILLTDCVVSVSKLFPANGEMKITTTKNRSRPKANFESFALLLF